jgi:prolyl 4-hydroxylase
MKQSISNVWMSWIRKGLDQGCAPHELLSVMIKDGMDPEASEVAIVQLIREPAAGKPVSNPFVYESSFIKAGNSIIVSDKILDLAFRLAQPDVVLITNFLSNDECEALIQSSLSRLTPSTVVNLQAGGRMSHDGRTSEGMAFKISETEVIKAIESRISELINLPIENGEGIQVLHYQIGAEYRPHYDYFPESQLGSKEFLEQGGQRVATLIMYLNDVDAGGETVFPELSLSVAPKKGSALYFSYTNSLGQVDDKTLHGGAPVVKGEKWIATKWIRKNLISKQ